ncbi:MAG: ABC transporter permease, partial [Bryobacteraceae bacterium]
MLRVLLAKDLRRAWRNPLPWMINLIVPLAMTALIGLAFGGKADNGALGRIRFAVVDEDKSVLSDLLRGSANQDKGGKYLEPVFMDRDQALDQVNNNKISAVLIIPTNFMRDYLTARAPVSLELIKNPAESINPAVLEELLGAVVTGLNAVSRNFSSEFPEWQAVVEGKADYHKVSFLIDRAGEKFKMAKQFINPPLVAYEKEESGGASNGADPKADKSKESGANGIFAFLLIGLSAMFLIFIGSNAMTDLHRELRMRTFERYQTMHQQLWPFIVEKIMFAVVVLVMCSAVMMGGGGLIFGIRWEHPVPLILLTLGYAGCVAALLAVLVAAVPDERRAGMFNSVVGMALGILGGCAFPPQQLPAFIREHVTPLMPSGWFAGAARSVEIDGATGGWGYALLKL